MNWEAEHEHEFGDARSVPPRTAKMCAVEGCTQWGVAWRQKWRQPTAEETISLLAHMIEATAIGRAMILIHGRDYGIRRAREVLGYD